MPQKMASKKDIIRRTVALVDHANAEISAARTEVAGMQQFIVALLQQVGGTATFNVADLNYGGGLRYTTSDDQTTVTLSLVPPASASITPEEYTGPKLVTP